MIAREARPDDAPRLIELFDELGHPIDVTSVRANLERLAELGLLPLVAEEDGVVVGACGLGIMQTIHRTTLVGRIATLIVSTEMRGRGIGALLVSEAERRLAAKGCGLIEVTSNETRRRAHAFYEKLGYERTSVRLFKRL